MSVIKRVHARQLVDCKCRPMVEVDVITADGYTGRGAAPTGSSVGRSEAFVLRDNNPAEYGGMGVRQAVENVNQIIGPAIEGMDVADQRGIDDRMLELDGTPLKERLGGNAIYSVSIAVMRAAAAAKRKPLYQYIAGGEVSTVPVPSFNVINGGRYEGLTQPFNEFIIMPYGADSIDHAVEMGIRIFQALEEALKRRLKHKPAIASSYGYSAFTEDPEEILSLMAETVEACNYTGRVGFALDCASSEMYDRNTNTYLLKGRRVDTDELIAYVKYLTERFDLVFVEDMLDEEDWEGYVKAKREITRTNILGDDLIATNRKRLERAYNMKAIDGFILKPNQVGTISEAMDAWQYARERDLIAVPSGRAGGVIRDVVMDFAVGLQVGFIKNGAPRSGERIDKLNFLMRACDMNDGCRLADISSMLKF